MSINIKGVDRGAPGARGFRPLLSSPIPYPPAQGSGEGSSGTGGREGQEWTP